MATHSAETARDLQAALRKAAPRDIIELNGAFGAVTLDGYRPEGAVTIRAAKPGAAHFESLLLSGCANLGFHGLSFWPLGPVPESRAKPYLVTAYPDSTGIEIDDCMFRGRADSDNHARWSQADWTAAKIGAVLLRGERSVIRNSAAIGVYFGYGVSGRNSEIFGNLVFGFAGDGLRVTDDNCVAIGNRVTDAMQIDENHSDGFQAFKVKALLNGLVVKDNVFLEWTVRPDNPLRAKMQGISLHNGPYANVVVRDNVVETSTANGIRLNAVKDVEVVGNRVRNANGPNKRHPWIWLGNCSGRMVVENNEAEQFRLNPGVKQRGNRKPDYTARY